MGIIRNFGCIGLGVGFIYRLLPHGGGVVVVVLFTTPPLVRIFSFYLLIMEGWKGTFMNKSFQHMALIICDILLR